MTTTIITGYTGERHITPSMDAKVYRGIFGNDDYILAEGNKCSGSMTDANTFVIMDGIVSLQGRQIQQSQETLSIATCASGYQRHDLVVMRYTHDADTGVDGAELAVIQGTAVTNNDPQDPEHNTGNIDDGANQVDMPLYRVALDGSSYDVQQLAPCLFDTTQSDLMLTDEVTDALEAIGISISGGVVQAVKALAEYLTPVTIRPKIDRSSGGTLQAVSAIKAGNRVDLQLTIANGTNVANAGNVFVGTIEEQYRPKVFVCGGGYYNGIHADFAITPEGAVTIRNTGTTSNFNGLNVGISYTV